MSWVNVQVWPELLRHENGGEYIALIVSRAIGVASTSDFTAFAAEASFWAADAPSGALPVSAAFCWTAAAATSVTA